jgi:hypothetical protein
MIGVCYHASISMPCELVGICITLTLGIEDDEFPYKKSRLLLKNTPSQ